MNQLPFISQKNSSKKSVKDDLACISVNFHGSPAIVIALEAK